MNEKVLKITFSSLIGALALTFALSWVFAVVTGYQYGPTVSELGYPALARGLVPLVGVSVLALIAVNHILRGRTHQIEQAMLRWLEARGEWVARGWDDEVEHALQEGVKLGQFPDGEEDIKDALERRQGLLRVRAWSARLFGVPAFAFAAIVALSLWAIPGFIPFLEGQVTLGTAFLYATSYGAGVAIAALFIALIVVLRE
ncbi:MAG: hypothetical protein ACE5EW_02565 [Thermoplasmata archaeon]